MSRETVIYKAVIDQGIGPRRSPKSRVYVTVESVGPDFVQIRTRVGLRLMRGKGYTYSLGTAPVTVSNDWRVGWT